MTETEMAGQGPAEYGLVRRALGRAKLEIWHLRLKRWLPRLVWLDDEVDVVVILSQDKLNPERAFEQLFSGAFHDVERIMRDMGITFDTGVGPNGRDWQWDWSLRGPISIRFCGRAKNPELRIERIMPRLVVNNQKSM